MICPNCKCEYIRGVTECTDCGVPLVDALDPTAENSAEGGRIVAIWGGSDPAECERVEEALESAGIPFTIPDTKGFFSFLPTEPRMEIWVSEEDQERARKLVSDLLGRVDSGELSPEEIESLALPESEPSDSGEQTTEPQDLPEHWYEDGPVAEVWCGEKEQFADTLVACLREIGIASHKSSDEGQWRLVVPPAQEGRAREIVREILEASPPE